MEFDIPYHGLCERATCWLWGMTYQNKAPPVLTQVCKESRQLALRTGRYIKPYEERAPYLNYRLTLQTLWFDPALDTGVLHMHYGDDDDSFDEDLETRIDGNYFEEFLWRAPKDGPADDPFGGIKASIMADVLFPFDPSPDWDLNSAERWEPNVLKRRNPYLAVVKMVCLHTPLEHALQTNLFGRLGEERIKLVDLSDRDRIRDYYNLYQRTREEEDKEP